MGAPQRERGFALVGAVFALVIIAALVAGGFFAARQELNVGRSSATYQRAFDAAEAGLNSTVATWNTGTLNALAVGDSATFTATMPGSTGSYSAVVRRLNTALFLIRSVGQDASGGSQRTIATITRLQLIQMNINASLTTRSSLKIGGSSFIDGIDTDPPGWTCPSAYHDTVAGILTRDSAQISTSGCNSYSCVRGDPKIRQDPTLSDSSFFKFGDLDWNELVAMATKTYPSGSIGPLNNIGPIGTASTCTTKPDGTNNNWGEPRVPATVAGCRYYFPIVYVPGNLKITGGVGQGILLVGNDLDVQGGAEFYGPVIVRGNLSTQGTGGHFNGGVMAANVDLQLSTVLGDAVITYSSCAITRALQYNAPGRLLAQRSWAELLR